MYVHTSKGKEEIMGAVSDDFTLNKLLITNNLYCSLTDSSHYLKTKTKAKRERNQDRTRDKEGRENDKREI